MICMPLLPQPRLQRIAALGETHAVISARRAQLGEDDASVIASEPLLSHENEVTKHSRERKWACLDTRISSELAGARVGVRIAENCSPNCRESLQRR